jgi:hypothetical protein
MKKRYKESMIKKTEHNDEIMEEIFIEDFKAYRIGVKKQLT